MRKCASLLLLCSALVGTGLHAEEERFVDKAGRTLKKGAEATGKGIEKGVEATGRGISKGADYVNSGLGKAGAWIGSKVDKKGEKGKGE